LEQTEWAQRCLLETSRAGFGETLQDRGDRVSSATTRAAMGDTLRGAAGFRDQSRFAAVAFASGEREGASCMVSFLIVIGAGGARAVALR